MLGRKLVVCYARVRCAVFGGTPYSIIARWNVCKTTSPEVSCHNAVDDGSFGIINYLPIIHIIYFFFGMWCGFTWFSREEWCDG